MNSAYVIEASSIEKSFGSGISYLRVLRGISLKLKKGESLSIVGPSGAGKSTLLNIIGCLDTFQRGELKVLGKDVSGLDVEDLSGFRNRHIGFIFQQHNLLQEFTALENVMLPLLIRRFSRSRSAKTAGELLDKFGLSARTGHKPGELSGGECQRIAVARALAGEPEIILADEPTGSLDSENTALLADMLISAVKDSGRSLIIVTHDTSLAGRADRQITVRDGMVSGEETRNEVDTDIPG